MIRITTLTPRGGPLLLAGAALLSAQRAFAQYPYFVPPPNTANQRNTLNMLRSQINWFQSATSSAPNYGAQGYGNVWGQFQQLRGAYSALKQTLIPGQSANGANALAELDAGLDIIQEAFGSYQNDVAAGRNERSALRDMCQVLRQGSRIWEQQLNKVCSQLRIGF